MVSFGAVSNVEASDFDAIVMSTREASHSEAALSIDIWSISYSS